MLLRKKYGVYSVVDSKLAILAMYRIKLLFYSDINMLKHALHSASIDIFTDVLHYEIDVARVTTVMTFRFITILK